jgi:hypothetical protein
MTATPRDAALRDFAMSHDFRSGKSSVSSTESVA